MRNELELMKQFEVEELEERLEFAKWTVSCKVSKGPQGWQGEVGGSCSF